MEHLLKDYLEYLTYERKLSKNSLKNYKSVVKGYIEYIEGDFDKISNISIAHYATPNTKYKKRVINSFLKFSDISFNVPEKKPINTYLQKFKDSNKKSSEKTMETYIKNIRIFLNENDKKIEDYTTEDVKAFITGTISRQRSRYYAIKKFFEFYDMGNIVKPDYLPASSDINNQKIVNVEESYLTENELKVISNYLISDNIDFDTTLNKVVLFTGISLGTRISELITIRVCDLKFELKKVKVLGKNNQLRYIQMNDYYISFIKKYIKLKNLQMDDYIVHTIKRFSYTDNGLSRRMRILFDRLGIRTDFRKISLHKLRHTYATILYNNNVDMHIIKNQLGHKNITNTEIYAKANSSILKKQLGKNYSGLKIKI